MAAQAGAGGGANAANATSDAPASVSPAASKAAAARVRDLANRAAAAAPTPAPDCVTPCSAWGAGNASEYCLTADDEARACVATTASGAGAAGRGASARTIPGTPSPATADYQPAADCTSACDAEAICYAADGTSRLCLPAGTGGGAGTSGVTSGGAGNSTSGDAGSQSSVDPTNATAVLADVLTGGSGAAGPQAPSASRYTVGGEACVFPAVYAGRTVTDCAVLEPGTPPMCQARPLAAGWGEGLIARPGGGMAQQWLQLRTPPASLRSQ